MHGILYTVMTGILWGIVGIILSYSIKRKINFLFLMFFYSLLSSVFSVVLIPDYKSFSSETFLFPVGLLFIMLAVSIFAGTGIYMMKRSMEKGPHGLIWALSQAAMIMPFLFSTVTYNENASIASWSGISMVLVSFILIAFSKQRGSGEVINNRSWLLMAFLSFLFIGISQCLNIIPSREIDLRDTYNLRVPMFFSFYTLIWFFLMAVNNFNTGKIRGNICIIIAYSVAGLLGQLSLYKSMDLLAKSGRTSIFYPLSIGICIIIFSLYGIFFLKEKTDRNGLAGIILITIGILLVSQR